MKETDFINKLGIGAFGYISISEFCGLFEYVFENVLIINKTEPKIIIWLPGIISLILFTTIVILGIKKYGKPIEIDTRKTLNLFIYLYSGILITQYLYVYLGTDFLTEKYFAEFDFYHKANKGSLMLRGYLANIPILQFIVFGIILLMKRKTVANTV